MRYTKCAKCQNYVPNVITTTCSDCDGICNYEEKQLTNADRIRAMRDEELREFICGSANCDVCAWSNGCSCTLSEWLRQPAKDGEDE